jgi:hypothetical protein
VVQRAARDLIDFIALAKESERKITVNISFLQLYNEKIFDLLNANMFKRKPGDKKMVFNMGSNNPE